MMNFVEMMNVCLGSDLEAKINLAKDEKTPGTFLEELSKSQNTRILIEIVRNPSTSSKVLEEMASCYFYLNQAQQICDGIFENPSTSLKTFRYLINEGMWRSKEDGDCWILGRSYSSPINRNKIQCLINAGYFTFKLVKNTKSKELLKYIIKSNAYNGNIQVMCWLIKNPNTSEEDLRLMKARARFMSPIEEEMLEKKMRCQKAMKKWESIV